MKSWWACNFILVLVGLVATLRASAADDQLQVSVNRWIEVRRPIGQVLYSRGQTSQPARSGMRLQAIGEGISTKKSSSAVLAIDIGTGFINVSENSNISIQKLLTGKGGERITQLQVKAGQVRLQVRPFTNSASRLEINTPAGVAGVRGTEFGVSVQQNGKMGVATIKGSVATNAQGQTVLVDAGFQNITIPGEPPSAPVPLKEDTRLNIRQLVANGSQVQIVGSVDPVNLLIIAKQPQNTDKSGNFELTVPLLANRRVEVVVVTPLGKKQLYELAVP
ncbi:FecR family protein [Cylindrospermum sp. FACHB-282]|uniref:FecR family protein n=1 Tax=Cylindrospermum sp. FACHB-282 TaxID=2692794 RepID=UPI0016858DBD|nr:FecR domain-containing protein [Cylindrospermum sp. FACHB-282]MBD2387648.1 FecR domain-containing protein [Cylindrospermum sp. FACHB-282]